MSLRMILFMFYSHVGLFQECGSGKQIYRDCQDYQSAGFTESGMYHVTPVGTYIGLDVYCDMITDNGGWLVFQRRQDGSEDFFLDWDSYQRGFGNVTGEHWIGNLPLHIILSQGRYMLRVDLEDFEGEKRHAKYNIFSVSDSSDKYRLTLAGYSGDAGNDMNTLHGQVFSTKDRDSTPRNCTRYEGGWWFGDCYKAHLNGHYLNGNHSFYAHGVIWKSFRGYYHSLKRAEMKIRRR